jgi:hypothetical protein
VDERDRWPAPGFQPAPSFRRTAVEPALTTTEPVHGRGNLLGLVIVVGLLAFFVADAAPGGPNAVATFFIAAGIVVVLFLVLVAVAVIIKRTRRPAPAPKVVDVKAVRSLRTATRTRLAPAEIEEPPRPAPPGSGSYFLRAVDELLAAVDRLPDDQVEWIEEDLLRFAASGAPADLHRLSDSRVAWRMYPQLDAFVDLASHLTERQLAYLSSVLTARRELR